MARNPNISEDITKEHFVRPIPFKAHKIFGFTPEMFERYYEDYYGGCIRSLNKIELKIASARQANEATSELTALGAQRSECIGSIVLQELFLEGLGEDGGEKLEDNDLIFALSQAFGSVANWQADFLLRAASRPNTKGWVVLAWCERFECLLNISLPDEPQALYGCKPILALNLRKEIYSSDFGSDRQSYINAYIQSIHWARAAVNLRIARGVENNRQQVENNNEQITVAELKHQMASNDTRASPLRAINM